MKTKSAQANALILLMFVAGLTVVARSIWNWECADVPRFFSFLLLAVLSSGMKVKFPGFEGCMSVVFLFTLLGVEELSLPETVVMICAATFVQCFWHAQKRPAPVQVIFNVSSIAVAVNVCFFVHNLPILMGHRLSTDIRLVAASATYFAFNTFPVSAVIAFVENKRIAKVWHDCYFWSFPYYLAGAVLAAGISYANHVAGWELNVLVMPLVYLIYRSYQFYLERLNAETRHALDQQKHAQDMADLHLRTIEALALAIEAKDHTTYDHLRRVQVYAVEIGQELGLSELELDALRAAALLHDIGKLAVPEHILSKPGLLTSEEFEKMKIHPVIGAEILEQVKFPYPVVPIVAAHHEKWNGKGYPYGLKSEEIPLGARILSAVDCLDALASDRQYRAALSLDEAMRQVASEAGESYDPRVVAILQRRYRELEQLAKAQRAGRTKLSKDIVIANGKLPESRLAPSGVEETLKHANAPSADFLQSIAAARGEVQALFEMTQDLGKSLSLHETFTALAEKLQRVIAHDGIAIYIVRAGRLIPEFVSGDELRLFGPTEISIGQGVSGWVAETRKAALNLPPSLEWPLAKGHEPAPSLLSTLSVPLQKANGELIGVITLYHSLRDAFSRDHLRILQALSPKITLSVENALRFRQAEDSADTDFLTGLPNARSLFVHLDREMKRTRSLNLTLGILVCDLDGFKQVNDSFGHLEGNRVLQMFGRGLKGCCRDSDYVARMGGDEFVLVLPGFEPESLPAKTDQLTRLVASIGRQVCGDSLMSVSVGAAFSQAHELTAEQLLAEADRQMYRVKAEHKTGRLKIPAGALYMDRTPLRIQ